MAPSLQDKSIQLGSELRAGKEKPSATVSLVRDNGGRDSLSGSFPPDTPVF